MLTTFEQTIRSKRKRSTDRRIYSAFGESRKPRRRLALLLHSSQNDLVAVGDRPAGRHEPDPRGLLAASRETASTGAKRRSLLTLAEPARARAYALPRKEASPRTTAHAWYRPEGSAPAGAARRSLSTASGVRPGRGGVIAMPRFRASRPAVFETAPPRRPKQKREPGLSVQRGCSCFVRAAVSVCSRRGPRLGRRSLPPARLLFGGSDSRGPGPPLTHRLSVSSSGDSARGPVIAGDRTARRWCARKQRRYVPHRRRWGQDRILQLHPGSIGWPATSMRAPRRSVPLPNGTQRTWSGLLRGRRLVRLRSSSRPHIER